MTRRGDTTPPSQRPSLPTRWPWIALLSVLFIASMPWLACPRLKTWGARRDAVEALARLSGCLFGHDPDRSDARLRARLIAADLQGPAPEGDWPQRCNVDAAALQVALEALHQRDDERCAGSCCVGDQRCEDLARLRLLLDQLRTALRSGDLPAGLVPPLFEQAAALNLREDEPIHQSEPPTPSPLPAPATMTALVRGRYDQRLTAHLDPEGLRLAFHQRAKVVTLCDVQLGAATARCFSAAPAVPVAGQLRLPDQAAEAPIQLLAEPTGPAPNEPAGAVYRAADGQRLYDLPQGSSHSTLWRDGGVTTLVRSGEATTLVRQTLGKPPEQLEIELPDPLSAGPLSAGPLSAGPLLAGDAMLWLTAEPGEQHRLHARPLQAMGPLAGASQDLGATGPLSAPELETCRMGSNLAVLLRSKPVGYDTAVAVALRGPAGWSPVLHAQVPSPWFGFTCHAATASLTWIEARAEEADSASAPRGGTRPVRGEYVATRLRCSPSGCRPEQAPVELSRWSRTSRYVIASLGSTALVLWRSPRGDARCRAAHLPDLPKAPTRTLFDDAEHLGFAWEQAGTTLLVQGTSALLLVEATTAGDEPATYAFVLDEGGVARPVTVTRAEP